MKRIILVAGIATASSLSTIALAGIDMDQTDPGGSNIVGTNVFNVNQRFTDPGFAPFNGAVTDDFIASGTDIAEVRIAIEASPDNLKTITNWHLAIFSSITAAGASGTTLTGDVVNADLGSLATYSHIDGTFAGDTAFLASFDGLDIGGLKPGGHYWMALAPDLSFLDPHGGSVFAFSSANPAVLGFGANDAFGINPGNGWGHGSTIAEGSNAALYMRTVPEPATLIGLTFGAVGLLRNRRRGSRSRS